MKAMRNDIQTTKDEKWHSKAYKWTVNNALDIFIFLYTNGSAIFLGFFLPEDGFLSEYYNDDIRIKIICIVVLIALYIYLHNRQVKDRKTEESLNQIIEEQQFTINDKNIDLMLYEEFLESVGNDFYELMNKYLITISNILKFEASERISIYLIEDDCFRLISRYSKHRDFCKINENKEKDKVGFLSKTETAGKCFEDTLPVYDKKDKKEAYKKALMKICSNISDEYYVNLKMKSATYYCQAITSTNQTYKAIIVFESLKAQAFSESSIENIVNQELPKLEIFVNSELINKFSNSNME